MRVKPIFGWHWPLLRLLQVLIILFDFVEVFVVAWVAVVAEYCLKRLAGQVVVLL